MHGQVHKFTLFEALDAIELSKSSKQEKQLLKLLQINGICSGDPLHWWGPGLWFSDTQQILAAKNHTEEEKNQNINDRNKTER